MTALERVGFRDVTRRQWALGDCVVVPLGRKDTRGPIAAYPGVAWLVPSSEGWDLVRPLSQHEWRKHFTSGDLALAAMIDVGARFAFPDRCAGCGSEVDGYIGERVGDDLRYWCATVCPKCGSQQESDGVGEMPEAWRDCRIARDGRWNVIVTEMATTATWKRARETLRLEVRDVAELRKLPNARIYSGTFGMATWVARKVGEALVELDPIQ